MLGTLTVVYAFNFVDRAVLSILLQTIKVDLHLSDTQIGFLTGIAFALFYATLGIPIARWADRGNRITIVSATTALWSVMVLLCGVAANFWQLLAARIGVAVGEAGCVPPAQSLIADHYARDERAHALSIYMLGAPISVVLGGALTGWVSEFYGWRAAFLVIGLPGLALAVIVRASLREPRLNRPRPVLAEASDRQSTLTVFRALWKLDAYRHLVIGFTLIYLFSYGIAQWVPPFLIRTHHISTGELGTWYGLIWGGGGAVGTFLGGYLTSRYLGQNERAQLQLMAVILLSFVPLYVGIYATPSLAIALSLMMIGAVIYCSIFGPLFAIIQEVVPAEMRAMSVAIVLLFSNLIGMGMGPIAVGVMSDALAPAFGTDSLRIALVAWTPGYFWAAFHLLRAAQYVKRDEAKLRHAATARAAIE